jgi:L-fucose isomerase-like protein
MKPLKVGFVTCVHPLYDLPAVVRHRDQAVSGLRQAGCEVVAARIPRTSLDAIEIASLLRASEIDLALLFFCTWVAEDITLALARELMDVPMLIWALPYLDKDVPMPSPISGLIASGSNIRRLGKYFAYMIGHVTPERVEQAIRAIRVAMVAGKLRRARFGIVGDPCPGMIDVEVDEADFEKVLGATAVHLPLNALLEAARTASSEEAAEVARRLISETGGIREVSEETLADNLRLYLGMKRLVEQNRLDAYCVRCWPELRDQLKQTVCVTHALMSRAGVPNCCEVDLPALITTYLLNQLAGTPAFSFDITGYLEEEGAIQFAHCGAAEPSLAGDPKRALLRAHMRTGTGATIEFPFQAGTVTLAKLPRPTNGKLKLFAARGQVIPSGEGVRGSVATVRPEPSAAAFIDKMMVEQVEHHVVLVYGDWMRDLAQFCDFTGVEYLPLASSGGAIME